MLRQQMLPLLFLRNFKMYKLQFSQFANKVVSVLRIKDNTSIPLDPANTCYQRYLVWLSEGNTPLPADEPVQQNEQTSS